MMTKYTRSVGFLTDGVGPGLAEQVAASNLGTYYSLRYNIYINLDGYFAEKADGVGPGWAQRGAASDVGMHYSFRPNVCFVPTCT